MNTYSLIFSGDILPGHDPETVKAQLLSMLKLAPEKSARVFSGRDIVLKAGLDETRAAAYRRKLASMGVGTRLRADTPPEALKPVSAAPSEPPPPPPATVLALEPMPTADADAPGVQHETASPALELQADEMECPECGQKQARRNLCIRCGVDMPRVAAALAVAAEEVRHPMDASIKIHDDAHDFDQQEDRPPYFGLSFEGRFGRRSYFVANFLVLLVAALISMAGAMMGSFFGLVVMIPALVIGLVLVLRCTVLRFHDFNWGGWWSLLLMVPGVGLVVSLLLLFMPGSKGANNFGQPPTPTPWLHAGLLAVVMVITNVMFLSTAIKAYADYSERARMAQSQSQSFAPGE